MEKSLSEYITEAKKIDDLKFNKKLKVAILSSFTLNGLDEALHVKCSKLGIRYISHIAGYNQYNQELIDSKSNLYSFSPDITFLILDIRKFFGEYFYKLHSMSDSEKKSFVKEKIDEIENLIINFEKNSNSKLVITNFNIPYYSPNGIIETKIEFGFHEIIEIINGSIRKISKTYSSVYVYDFNLFVSKFGAKVSNSRFQLSCKHNSKLHEVLLLQEIRFFLQKEMIFILCKKMFSFGKTQIAFFCKRKTLL